MIQSNTDITEALKDHQRDNQKLLDEGYWHIEEKKDNSPTEIIIKQPDLNITSTDVRQQKLPKPENLKEYIGQSNNKQLVLKTIKIINIIRPINIFLHGYPGCGKTTLSEIIAKELDAHFIYTIPEQLKDIEKIKDVLNTIQTSKKLVVWMVDEIHNIDKKLINILLPVLHDYKLGNTPIKQFVFIGATTDYNKLYKKSEALVSRFQTKIKMDKYNIDEIATIIKQYHQKMNLDIDIPENDYILIAKNSKGVPREAINLLLKRLVSNNVEEVLKDHKIIANGITITDIKILETLSYSKEAIGSSSLSQQVNMLKEDFEYVYEPYLVEQGFIERTKSGRRITNKGEKILEELQK